MRLRYLGFCGVDDTVSADKLHELSSKYPFIEWGVLFRSDKQGTPRYASIDHIQHIVAAKHHDHSAGLHLAAHLCGDYCEDILLHANCSKVSWLVSLGFKRFQLNPTAANSVHLNKANAHIYVDNIRNMMLQFPAAEFIIQANEETAYIWEQLISDKVPSNLSVLFDASCGTGVELSSVRPPLPSIPCGYAGGISTANIKKILHMLQEVVAETPIWIDMESSLRKMNTAGGDEFSLEACMSCIDTAISAGVVPP
jgi:phosphoribosylanthranilate isomerase